MTQKSNVAVIMMAARLKEQVLELSEIPCLMKLLIRFVKGCAVKPQLADTREIYR